jgi:hypothetical protein
MNQLMLLVFFALSTTSVFADGVTVTEKDYEERCRSTSLSKSIEIFLGTPEKDKAFARKKTWQNKEFFIEAKPRLTTKDIEYVSPAADRKFKIVFTPWGAQKLSKMSRGNLNKYLVFVVNGEIGLAPEIKDEMTNNEATISDATQTDGKSFYSKMCPGVNNVQVKKTPVPKPVEPAKDKATESATPETKKP